MEKEQLLLSFEFIFGPIQRCEKDKNGNEITGIKVVDSDGEVQKLDKELNSLWDSIWVEDKNESSGFKFDLKRQKEIKNILIDKFSKLLNRLNQINDGSFEIEDRVTKELNSI